MKNKPQKLATSFLAIFFLFVNTESVFAQHSLVPANHPVYSWLHQQRVAGYILDFEYEDLPVTRGEVVGFLKTIEKKGDNLSGSDRATLAAYLQEFDPSYLERSAEHGFFTSSGTLRDKFKYFFTSKDEPHIFAVHDTTNEVYGAFDMFLFGRAEVNAWDAGDWLWSRYYFRGVRVYTSIQDFVGVHFEADNVSALGDYQLLKEDDFWGVSDAQTRQHKDNSYSYEAFLTLKKKILSFDIGRGSLRIGPGISSPLLLRETAPNFNWMRFKISTSRVKYTAIHGSLYAKNHNDIVVVGSDTALTRIAPERWLTLHRLSFKPIDRLQLSVTEMLVYSNRGADLSYLNPVAPIFFSELENSDRDNAFMAVDLVAQPVNNVEVFATLMIDDLKGFKSIFEDKATVDDDVAMNFGATVALPYASQFGIGYTRIEPFVYTHWQRLNTFDQRDRSLGHYLGPNADELEFRIKKWLPYRSWVQLAYRNVRKGYNPTDENGEIINVGGDLLDGSKNLGYKMFQGSNKNRWGEIELSAQAEPWRGLVVSANIYDRNVFDGSDQNDFRMVDLRIRFGF